MESVPASVTVAITTVFAIVQKAKPIIRELGIPDRFYKLVVWLFAVGVGMGVFLFVDGVSDSFNWIYPNAPNYVRVVMGGIVLGTGSDFARLLFAIKKWGDVKYLNTTPESAAEQIAENSQG